MTAQVIKLGEGYYFLQVKNLMSNEELSEVWEEIIFLSYRSKLSTDTRTATTNDGELKSNKIGMWLDEVYNDRIHCNFFKYYKKWVDVDFLSKDLPSNHLVWRTLQKCDDDRTLLSYYEDNQYYKSHMDASSFTQLFWTFKTPKKFSGGELVFTDFNYKIEIENNMMVLFPSWLMHEVKPVLLEEKTPDNQDKLLCNGRYVFTTFYS